MEQTEYKDMVNKLRTRLSLIDSERADLDARRSDLDKEASSIKNTLADLLPLCGEVADPDDLSGLGFTNAIRKVLSLKAGEWMAASEVKESLAEKGFELSTYANPMASIYKILSRLADSKEIEVKTEMLSTRYRAIPRRRRMLRAFAGHRPVVQQFAEHATVNTWMDLQTPAKDKKEG
jgi:hypothetical protein